MNDTKLWVGRKRQNKTDEKSKINVAKNSKQLNDTPFLAYCSGQEAEEELRLTEEALKRLEKNGQ